MSSCATEWPHLHIMPFEQLMQMDSCECLQDELQSHLQLKRMDDWYEELIESILDYGFQPGFAPEIIHDSIYEGHHRIAAMQEISGIWCPWQDIENDNQWEADWETYVYPRTDEVFAGARSLFECA